MIGLHTGSKRHNRHLHASILEATRRSSKLAPYLLRGFAWGNLSLPQVQRIAALCEEDAGAENTPRELRILASLGNHGRYTNNLRRDLIRQLRLPDLTPVLVTVPLKCKNSSVRADVPFLEPDVLFQSLLRQPLVFKELICRDPEDIKKFWLEVGDSHPALKNHVVKRVPEYATRAVPVILHGDGVPVTAMGPAQKSCAFVSWRSLLSKRSSSRITHMLITAIWSDFVHKGCAANTVACVWKHVVRCFERAMEHSQQDNGPFPVPLFCTGDLEWYADSHNLPRWNESYPCGHCNVHKQNMFDFKNTHEVPVDPWSLPRDTPCPLFRTLMSPQGVIPDWMHTKHLGTDQRLAGSCLWLLCWHLMPDDLESNLHNVVLQMKARVAKRVEDAASSF